MGSFIAQFGWNLLVVAGGIAVFALPFVTVFALRHRREVRDKRPHINQFMEFFLVSRESNALVFCWALAEALVWWVIPEFLLVLIVFMKVRHKVSLLTYDLAGTIVGTVIALTWRLPDELLLRVPYVYPRMLTQTDEWYRTMGTLALVNQPFSGVPYKVFLAHAPTMGFWSALVFIGFAVVVRLSRYVIGYSVAVALFPIVHPFVYRNYVRLLIGAVVIFTLLLMRVSAIYS